MSRPIKSDLDFRGTSRVTNLPAPLDDGDAVSKSYLNSALQGAGVSIGPIVQNKQTVTSDVTIDSGNNAFSVGSITIAEGVRVTIPSGSLWVIL